MDSNRARPLICPCPSSLLFMDFLIQHSRLLVLNAKNSLFKKAIARIQIGEVINNRLLILLRNKKKIIFKVQKSYM